jgi:Rieske 2Fe-2S family protein
MPNDHAPAHRDSEPGRDLQVAQSLSIDPRGTKRFFLQSADGEEVVDVDSHLYWFNDMDYHGVHADPFFRYSIRVDGVYRPSFLKDLQRRRRG